MGAIVIKIGGGKGIDPTGTAPEIAALVRDGLRVVVVHGGSNATSELQAALGHPARMISSPGGQVSRRTDARTVEILAMACAGRVNTAVVAGLRAAGVNAIGLSGVDGGVWVGARKEAIRSVEEGRTVVIRDDLSGRVESVNADLLAQLLDGGFVPVLCPPALTPDGLVINVDADRAAARTASAIGADELLLLSNVPGLLRDPSDSSSLIESVGAEGLEGARGAAGGRMKVKVLAAEEALAGGVGRVVIGSAVGDGAIARARGGRGTVFALEAVS